MVIHQTGSLEGIQKKKKTKGTATSISSAYPYLEHHRKGFLHHPVIDIRASHIGEGGGGVEELGHDDWIKERESWPRNEKSFFSFASDGGLLYT